MTTNLSDTPHELADTPTYFDDTGESEPSSRGRVATTILAVALAATTMTAAILGWHAKQQSDLDRASAEALAAAQQYAVALTSIDAGRIDQDLATIRAGATGEFEQLSAQSAAQLKPLLVQAQSVSKGRVTSSGLQSASTDTVVAMLFVDAEITNTTIPQARIDRSRMLITMKRVDGHWLASKVEIV
ncbi:Mce protein [Nocardia bovistercoris]|nr:Mce protein [Nocardia bovistercoris]